MKLQLFLLAVILTACGGSNRTEQTTKEATSIAESDPIARQIAMSKGKPLKALHGIVGDTVRSDNVVIMLFDAADWTEYI
jgi:hypothetical protein